MQKRERGLQLVLKCSCQAGSAPCGSSDAKGTRAEAYLIHARGREEDAHLLGILLQLTVLSMAELQVPLVLAIRLPPGVL